MLNSYTKMNAPSRKEPIFFGFFAILNIVVNGYAKSKSRRMILKKTLIVGAAWVGDMVMSQPLFYLLKNQGCEQLDVLAPAWTHGILSHMPEVDNAINLPIGHGQFALEKRYALGKMLRASGYSQAIVIPNSWKSALIPYFANIPKRTGWLGEMRYGLLNDPRKLDKKRYPLMIQRLTALAFDKEKNLPPHLPKPILSLNEKARELTCDRHHVSLNPPRILALCPGAQFGPAKQWPAEHFASVANLLMDLGWQTWLFGSKDDTAICDQIQLLTENRCHNFAGKTNLSESIELLSLSRIVISNDSGLMHVAAALNKPLIALYGSSSPDFTPPLTQYAQVLSLKLDCSPCFARTCPLQHLKCLKDLTPPMVIECIEEFEKSEIFHD
jgi:heptosyltransferase II